ncbi:MAG: hypothetical protein GQ526_11530 [Ardenticatenales bacterium]|nr:hypothetical protein [Ardenticatenales bacterium]
MSDGDQEFFPLAALERASTPLLRSFALLLIVASLWGIVNQFTQWSRPVKLEIGVAGMVQEERLGGTVRYSLPFVTDSGQEMTLWLRNNSPVLDYFLTSPSTTTIAVRYWPDDMSVVAVHPLIVDVPPIADRFPPSGVLLATSILGLLLGLTILFSSQLDGSIHRLSAPSAPAGSAGSRKGQRSRRL